MTATHRSHSGLTRPMPNMTSTAPDARPSPLSSFLVAATVKSKIGISAKPMHRETVQTTSANTGDIRRTAAAAAP